jgi:NAD(P)-dependent dehydrogenase (short-subunit alcohol dehydrogenase family)
MAGFKNLSIVKLVMDVTSDVDVENVVKAILDAEGRIDILVNNAGIIGISMFVPQQNLGDSPLYRSSGRFVS